MLYYWLSAIGVCFIVKYGSILKSIKEYTINFIPMLDKLYKCCLCMGFWVGLIILMFFMDYKEFEPKLLLFPLSCSAICWIADTVMNLMIDISYDLNNKSE